MRAVDLKKDDSRSREEVCGDIRDSKKQIACLVLAAILAVIFGQGCTTILASDVSGLQLSTNGNPQRALALDSFTIKVFPENRKFYGLTGPVVPIYPFWSEELKHGFWFRIYILPKNGEITIDLRRIALETERGETFFAAGFTGPLLYSDINKSNLDFGTILFDEKHLNPSLSQVSISAEALIGVMFETNTIDPDQHFTLIITGLESGGHQIEVPPLKFDRLRTRHVAFSLFGPLRFQTEWEVQ